MAWLTGKEGPTKKRKKKDSVDLSVFLLWGIMGAKREIQFTKITKAYFWTERINCNYSFHALIWVIILDFLYIIILTWPFRIFFFSQHHFLVCHLKQISLYQIHSFGWFFSYPISRLLAILIFSLNWSILFLFRYIFEELYLHWGDEDSTGGSEHSIDKYFFPAEAQLVAYNMDLYHNVSHASGKTHGVVAISVMIQVADGRRVNRAIRTLTQHMKKVDRVKKDQGLPHKG